MRIRELHYPVQLERTLRNREPSLLNTYFLISYTMNAIIYMNNSLYPSNFFSDKKAQSIERIMNISYNSVCSRFRIRLDDGDNHYSINVLLTSVILKLCTDLEFEI